MKKIPLINSKECATIDDENFYLISKFLWYRTPHGHAATNINGVEVLMDNMIMFPDVREYAE